MGDMSVEEILAKSNVPAPRDWLLLDGDRAVGVLSDRQFQDKYVAAEEAPPPVARPVAGKVRRVSGR